MLVGINRLGPAQAPFLQPTLIYSICVISFLSYSYSLIRIVGFTVHLGAGSGSCLMTYTALYSLWLGVKKKGLSLYQLVYSCLQLGTAPPSLPCYCCWECSFLSLRGNHDMEQDFVPKSSALIGLEYWKWG